MVSTNTQSITKEQDSFSEEQVLLYRDFIKNSTTNIIDCDDYHTSIYNMLKAIGSIAKADRAVIFQYSSDYSTVTFENEWHREEAPALAKEHHSFSSEKYANWLEALQSGKYIKIDNADAFPKHWQVERAFFEYYNVKSTISTGIWIDGKLKGFIALNRIIVDKPFTTHDAFLLQHAAVLYVLAKEQQRHRSISKDNLSLQRQVFGHTIVPLVLFDLNHNIVAINQSGCDLIGKSEGEVIGKKCHDLICKNCCPPEWCLLEQAKNTGENAKIELEDFGGKHIFTVQPIYDRDGQLIYGLESVMNVTEFENQKDELLGLNSKLQESMEEATLAVKAKSTFLTTMSHEIRTPLNAVLGFTKVLLDERVSLSEQHDYLLAVQQSGENLLRLINDVLNLTKIDELNEEEPNQPCEVDKLCAELLHLFALEAEKKSLELKVESLTDIPQVSLCISRLRQVLLNLMSNAVKYTNDGRVIVSLSSELNEFGNSDIIITISDTGLGIPKEYHATIFEPFAQQINPDKSKDSAGLGLAVAKRLTEAMGGEINFASEVGEGSTFSIKLFDLENVTCDTQVQKRKKSKITKSKKIAKKVLIVDDILLNTKVLSAMLRSKCDEFAVVGSGKEALEALEHFDADLVLTDMWMPGMTGFELAAEIRKNPKFAKTKILTVTADIDIEFIENAEHVDAILHKPVSLDMISAILDAEE